MAILDQLVENFSTDTLSQFFSQAISTFKSDDWDYDFLFDDNENIQESYSNIQKLGDADLQGGDDILVISAETSMPLTDRSGKKLQYEIAKKILKEEAKDAAFFIFYDADGQFRFSFIRADFKGTKREFTTFKRYTYFVSPSQTNQTFIRQLSACSFQDLDDIQKAFSVEPLNKEFYQKIAKAFYGLIGGKVSEGSKAKEYKASLQLPSLDSIKNRRTYQEFAVRFIGRTIFIWFLKNKTSDAGLPLIPSDWLTSTKVASIKEYYHNLLEKLFFEILNTPIDERISSLPPEHTIIPFLNGGLFEPQRDDFYEAGFNDFSKHHNTLIIPDKWIQNLFETLEQFNFTIDENTLTDMEVSIDPEMLGTIFENLLAEIDPDTKKSARKSTGSFYTPREIVDYMVVESLVALLHTKTNIAEELLHTLFGDGDLHLALAEYKNVLIDAFDKMKILDPACGSGAFPMGALHKINLALQKLDPDAEVWKEKQLSKIENVAYRNALRDKLNKSNVDYVRKIGIIQHSIYGVDVQPIATEISKLRSFLSLVVDESIDDSAINRGIYPLPNLEFKFVTANTLIGLQEKSAENSSQETEALDFGGVNKDIERLQRTRDLYLQSYGEEKKKLKSKFLNIQQQIAKKEFSSVSTGGNKGALQIIGWNPFSHEKADWWDPRWMFGVSEFDVVLANPPYIDSTEMTRSQPELREHCTTNYFSAKGNWDIYIPFYERGYTVLNRDGVLAFITPNKWLSIGYGKNLRKLLHGAFSGICRCDKIDVFEAGNSPVITFFRRISAIHNVKVDEFNPQREVNYISKMLKTIYNDNWGMLLSDKIDLLNIINRKGEKLSKKFDVENPFTTGEAYQIKSILSSNGESAGKFKFINTGTIDPFISLWGKKLMTYIKDRYEYPVIAKSMFKSKFPKRYLQASRPKLIITGMRYFESFLDMSGDFIAGKSTIMVFSRTDDVDELHYLNSVLNARLISFLIRESYSALGIDGGINFSKPLVQNLPVMLANRESRSSLISISTKLGSQTTTGDEKVKLMESLNIIVYKIFDIDFKSVIIIDPDFKYTVKEYENFKYE